MWSNPAFGGDPRHYGNYERTVQNGGWYPLFWNSEVQKQLIALITALGNRFKNEEFVEGFSIGETSVANAPGFGCAGLQDAFRSMALAAKASFGDKIVFQMINFACYDLIDYAAWLHSQGIGLGTPDVFIFKDYLTNTVYPLMLKYRDSVAVGPDVQ